MHPKPAEIRHDGKISWELKRIDSVAKDSISFVLDGLDEAEYDESDLYVSGINPALVIGAEPLPGDRELNYSDFEGEERAAPEPEEEGEIDYAETEEVLEFIRDMIRDSKSSTLREMYYISEGWDIAKFHAQEESNLLAEDLEVITQLLREDFKLRPEESGASVIGNLTLEEITRNGDRKRINCRDDVGDAGYTIPYNVEKEKVKLIEADAKFILA